MISTPFLAEAAITPHEVDLGGSFDMVSDVPANFGLVWIFTVSIERPNTVQEPFPFYGDPATAVVVPGILQGQNTQPVTVPNNPVLPGFEDFVQPVVFPLSGPNPYPVGYHMPRGGRVTIE